MRALVIAMAVLLSAGSAQGTPATPKQHPPQKPIFVPDYPGMLAMRTNYAPRGATVTPSQISACANVAAMRALGARASGADSVNQGRVADLAFVLCLVNAPVEN
jgi:hypothetical protein